jgi:microcystin-dependent protein
MGSPYTSVAISGYNANPPADDGSQTSSNQLTWAKHKTKLGDPLKTLAEAINTNVVAAFGKTLGSANVVEATTNYDAAAVDQGRVIVATADSITITTPDLTSVNAPFAFEVQNNSSGDITLDGYSAQTINGATTLVLEAGAGGHVHAFGSNWIFVGARGNVAPGSAATTGDMIFRLTSNAKPGWIKSDGRTIGNASSGATSRANADTEALFKQLWVDHDNTLLPIQDSSGSPTTRGASAAADFAANKRLPTVDMSGYVPAGLDNMSGTSRDVVTNANADTLGKTMGAELHTLLEAELAQHDHPITDNGHNHTGTVANVWGPASGESASPGGGRNLDSRSFTTSTNTTGITVNNAGSNTPHNNMQPTRFGSWWVKL